MANELESKERDHSCGLYQCHITNLFKSTPEQLGNILLDKICELSKINKKIKLKSN